MDAVFCSHVLEHVNDAKALQEIHRILKPGGRLIAMVPTCEGRDKTYENPEIVSSAGGGSCILAKTTMSATTGGLFSSGWLTRVLEPLHTQPRREILSDTDCGGAKRCLSDPACKRSRVFRLG